MVGPFLKVVAFAASKFPAINCDRAKPDLEIPRKQIAGNLSAGAQLGQELADPRRACRQFYRNNPLVTLFVPANEKEVTSPRIGVNRRRRVFQAK